jgi:hypothetical protein
LLTTTTTTTTTATATTTSTTTTVQLKFADEQHHAEHDINSRHCMN